MKKSIYATLILAMAASTAIAKDLTVTHVSWGDYNSFRARFKQAMADAGISDYSEITSLKVITQPNSTIGTTYFSTTYTPEGGEQEGALRDLLKANLEEADFSEAKFQDDLLPPAAGTDAGGFLPGMAKLRRVVLPEGLRLVSGGAFKNCKALVTVEMPASVINIGDNAFRCCESLQLSELPAGLQKIGSHTFSGVDMNNSSLNTQLEGITISELPEEVFTIGESAFDCSNVSFAKLPDGLKELGNKAFRKSLVTINTFPESLFASDSKLGNATLVLCYNVTEFYIPDVMTSIPSQTFYWDKSVTSPQRVFYCNQTTPPTASFDTSGYTGAFGNHSNFSFVTFYVPENSVDAYKAKDPYKTMNFLRIFETEKEIGDLFEITCAEGHDFIVRDLEWKMIEDGEAVDLNINKEGVYTLQVTPIQTQYDLQAYIHRIYIPEDNNVESTPDAGEEEMPSFRVRAASSGDLYNSGNDFEPKTVTVDIPVYVDSPKLVVELMSTHMTGVESIQFGADEDTHIYNLSGVVVASGKDVNISDLPAGIYIVKQRNKTHKIVR